MTNEEMAALAEIVRSSLQPDFKEVMDELKKVKEQVDRIEEKVNRMYEKMGWDAS